MNCSSRRIITSIRTYATKSKTTNLKWKPSTPVEQTTLSDGSVFIARQPVVSPVIQAQAAPLLHKKKSDAINKELDQSEINEMRQLRQTDPSTWTRSKLAKKFGCSELFVSIAAPKPITADTKTAFEEQQAEAIENQGYRRRLITQERQKRKALW